MENITENITNTIGIGVKDIKKVFTPKQFAIIKDNLRAYFVNMGYICIEKADYGKGWYIFKSAEDVKNGSYVQFCENIDYLNGWLYGVVQAVNGIIKANGNKDINMKQYISIFMEF
ncbi:hypothetical protein DXA02_13735 [Ruminococcus sp. AM54-1NS]|nr:hypothetical protein DXA02_13735 [Ruminococcus sp. AM54-1NS]